MIDENALWRQLSRDKPSVVVPFADPIFLDSHTLLAHYRFADGAFYGAYELDMRTNKVRSMRRLTEEIQRHGYLKPDTWSLSPDHRWILWRDGWLEKEYPLYATRRDGSESRRWTLRAPEDRHKDTLFWLPGPGHSFVDVISDDGATLDWARFYSLDTPGNRSLQTISLRSLHAGTHVLGFLPDKTLLTSDDWDTVGKGGREPHQSVTLTAFQLATPMQARRETVRVDKGQAIQQLLLSPDGKQLAWLISDKGANGVTLAISRPNGGDRRAVTRFPIAREDDAENVRCVSWTSDCRAVLVEQGYVANRSACFVEAITIHRDNTIVRPSHSPRSTR